ncbi:hypothetical protein Tco_1215863 [Tanacetum coccineum]
MLSAILTAFQDKGGEVNLVHAYYNGSCTSKDNEDPSWSISFKTRRTSKTSSALEALWKTLFMLYLYKIGTLQELQGLELLIVVKVSSNSSTPGISPDVAALTTEVSELKNMMKTMLIDKQKAQAPVPVKAVEQSVSKTDFENYVKANDAVLRNMQNQGQGSLPSNTVTNPKEDLKGITTRSGVAYQGPTIRTTSSPKVVCRCGISAKIIRKMVKTGQTRTREWKSTQKAGRKLSKSNLSQNFQST